MPTPLSLAERPVLVAPDSFKGTLSATEVAQALATGLREGGLQADLCPVGDGGEGTLDALASTLEVQRRQATVSDPLGRPVQAEYGLVHGRRGAPVRAIIELAAASGLHRVGERERCPLRADTFGTGELVAAALADGVSEVLLCAGGSASTDGGAGALRAIDAAGGLGAVRMTVLCDVRTPYEEAAAVFGPQKGASPAVVRRLSRRLAKLTAELPRDPRGVPMTGAAGGLAGGLWAALGAELVPGAAHVLDAIGFDGRMLSAQAVITGEGRLDGQSLAGKAVAEVATRARQSGVPCLAVVGERALGAFEQRILDLQSVREACDPDALRLAGQAIAQELASAR